MKTAIYIEDGVVQLVLTPDSDFEKNALASFQENTIETKIMTGGFYDCRGGWTRQNRYYPGNAFEGGDLGDKSLIIRSQEAKDD